MKPDFEDYVASRSGALLRFAYLLCGDRHLAEDLVQETLIKAHRRWSAIEAENPDGYLKRALVRTHVSWLRRRASREIAVDSLPDGPMSRAFDESPASHDETWERLSALPRAQRAVLVLRYYEDLDDRRIAEVLGVTPSTVRVHAHRGLAALRETLAQRADQAPTGAGMLDSVREGAASAARRRRAIAAGGIAALVGMLALLIPLLRPTPAPPPIEPTPSVTTNPTVSPSITTTPPVTPTSDLVLVPTTLSAPTFPYTLGYVPAGLGPAFVAFKYGMVVVAYGGDASDGVDPPLAIYVKDDQGFGDPGEDAVRSAVTVNGSPATQWETPGWAELEWSYDGRWFYAFGVGPIDAAELVRIAEAMTPGTSASETTGPIGEIESLLLPPGYALTKWHLNKLCAAPGSDPGSEVCITVSPDDPGLPRVQELTIDGAPAYVSERTYRSLVVQRSADSFVHIEWGSYGFRSLTVDELVTLYRGIEFAS